MNVLNLTIGFVICLTPVVIYPVSAQREIMVGWEIAASAPGVGTLVWSDPSTLPPAAIADLEDLRAAIMGPGSTNRQVKVAENGRVVALVSSNEGDSPVVPSGVTVWPDWQIADATIHFDYASKVRFLSGHHVLLSQHPKEGPWVSFIVDIRRPTTRFQFSGYQLGTLSITDAGKWAALTTDGSLNAGKLNTEGVNGTVSGTPVPFSGTVNNLIWRNDGRFLLVEKVDGGVDSLRASDWSVASNISARLGPYKGSVGPIGRDACFASSPSGSCVLSVSSEGVLSATRWPTQVAGEASVYVSPLRKFLITRRNDTYPFVVRACRKTPEASDSDIIPSWPSVPVGTKIHGFGWLLWLP